MQVPDWMCDLADWWVALDRGNVAEWAGVLVTGAAFFVAYLLYRVEQGRDQAREDQLTEDRRAAAQAQQADKVATWPSHTPKTTHKGVVYGRKVQVTISNRSELPVFDVRLTFVVINYALRYELPRIDVLPPGETVHDWPQSMMNDIRTRAAAEDWPIQHFGDLRVLHAIEFRDAANRLWSRNEYGVVESRGVVVQAVPATGSLRGFAPEVSAVVKPEATDGDGDR